MNGNSNIIIENLERQLSRHNGYSIQLGKKWALSIKLFLHNENRVEKYIKRTEGKSFP